MKNTMLLGQDQNTYKMETVKYIKGELFNGRGGSSKRGEIIASYSDLTWMFGTPAYEGIGDKITTEFSIDYLMTDKDGETTRGNFRLYDWYFARDLNCDVKETVWNVGGFSTLDYDMAEQAINQFMNTDLKYGDTDSCVLESELVVIT